MLLSLIFILKGVFALPEPKGRMNVMIDQVVTLKNYLTEQPDRTEKVLMEALGFKKNTLYRLLIYA